VKQCADKLTVTECKEIFDSFWQTGDYDAQNMYIAGCIEQNKVSICRIPNSKAGKKSVARSYACKYSVQTGDRRVTVCKTVFLSLVGVSSGRINTVLQNQ